MSKVMYHLFVILWLDFSDDYDCDFGKPKAKRSLDFKNPVTNGLKNKKLYEEAEPLLDNSFVSQIDNVEPLELSSINKSSLEEINSQEPVSIKSNLSCIDSLIVRARNKKHGRHSAKHWCDWREFPFY